MQAEMTGKSETQYGYKDSTKKYGSMSPNFIYHQREKYEIESFYSDTIIGFNDYTYLFFKNRKIVGKKIIIEVNNTVYTMELRRDYYRITGTAIFQSAGIYTIKILSTE